MYHAIVPAPCYRAGVLLISIPIGVLVAVYLVEYGGGTGWASHHVHIFRHLTGVPSIVTALFIYALWVATLGTSDPVSPYRWRWCC